MKSLSGDFGVNSKVLNIKFKDKNDSSIYRALLGSCGQIRERFNIYYNVFTDMGYSKGIGGQINVSYKF